MHVGDVLPVEYPTGGRTDLTVGGIFDDNNLLGNGGADYLISLGTYAKGYTSQLDSVVYVIADPGPTRGSWRGA